MYSFSPAKHFQLPLYKGEIHPPVVFDQPGLVVLGCNIHDSMVGYIYVTPAPYFGVTDASGTLLLKQVPKGDYQIVIWSPYIADTRPLLGTRFESRATALRRSASSCGLGFAPSLSRSRAARTGIIDAPVARSGDDAGGVLATWGGRAGPIDPGWRSRCAVGTRDGRALVHERRSRHSQIRSRARRRRARTSVPRSELAHHRHRLFARRARYLRRSQSKPGRCQRALSERAAVSDGAGALPRTYRGLLHAGLARESRHRLDGRVFDHSVRREHLDRRGVPDDRCRDGGALAGSEQRLSRRLRVDRRGIWVG